MKKFLAMILMTALLMGVCLPAQAVEAQYNSTKALLAEMDAIGITYTVLGVNEDGYERVTINNEDDNGFEYTLYFFFEDNEENASIRVWDIITYSDADFAKVLRVCNALNTEYKYVNFNAEESDNTVTAAVDFIYRTHDVGPIVKEGLLHLVNILEDAYPRLSVYNK